MKGDIERLHAGPGIDLNHIEQATANSSLTATHRNVAACLLLFCSIVLVISVLWIPMSARTDGDWGANEENIVHHRRCTGSTFPRSDKGREPVTLWV